MVQPKSEQARRIALPFDERVRLSCAAPMNDNAALQHEVKYSMEKLMFGYRLAMAGALTMTAFSAQAGDFDAAASHRAFMDAFNNRDWDTVKSVLTEDSVFHRASGEDAFVGPAAIVERFSSTIGAPDQWNVKFAKLSSSSELTGKDGRVVERGDFAVTAGADDDSCYAGSYMMTWAPAENGWGLQLLAWQDVEVDLAGCQ